MLVSMCFVGQLCQDIGNVGGGQPWCRSGRPGPEEGFFCHVAVSRSGILVRALPKIDDVALPAHRAAGRMHETLLLQLLQQADDPTGAQAQTTLQFVGGFGSPFLQELQQALKISCKELLMHGGQGRRDTDPEKTVPLRMP